jgi:FkbH-like protein
VSEREDAISRLLALPVEQKRAVLLSLFSRARMAERPDRKDDPIEHFLVRSLNKVLSLPLAAIDLRKTALDHGMDSISYLEWANYVGRSLGIDVPAEPFALEVPLADWVIALRKHGAAFDSIAALALGGPAAPPSDGERAPRWLDRIFEDAELEEERLAAPPADELEGVLQQILEQKVALRVEGGKLVARTAQRHDWRAAGLIKARGRALKAYLGRNEIYPALPVQRRYWLLAELTGEPALYTNVIGVAVDGELDELQLRDVCWNIVQCEKAFRIVLRRFGDVVGQEVRSAERCFDFAVVELPAGSPDAAANAAASETAIDKENGPYCKFRLFRAGPGRSYFYVIADHAISDAFSLLDLLRTVFALLAAPADARALPKDWRIASYCDNALTDDQEPSAAADVEFWRTYLRDAPYNTPLPVEPAASDRKFAGDTQRLVLPEATVGALRERALGMQTTLFTLLSAAVCLALHSWTKEPDLVVGCPVQIKPKDSAGAIGDHTNTVPLRSIVAADDSLRSYCGVTAGRVRAALSHARCPFEVIANVVPRKLDYDNPLFNVMVNELPSQDGLLASHDRFRVSLLDSTRLTGTARLQLMLYWTVTDGALSLCCEYRTALFRAHTVRRVLDNVLRVARAMVERPDDLVGPLLKRLIWAGAEGDGKSDRQEDTPARAVCIASTFVAEPVATELELWLEEFDWPRELRFADYGQVFQSLLDPKGPFAANTKGVNVLLVRLEDLTAQDVRRTGLELLAAAAHFAEQHRAPLLLVVTKGSPKWLAEEGSAALLEDFLQSARARLEPYAHCTVIAPDRLDDLYPVANYYDADRELLGNVPYTDEYYRSLASLLMRHLFGLWCARPKVVVLDCDNTLWRGVVGEEGVQGIELSSAHVSFQRRLLAMREAGVLLCLCSKNVESDVLAAFDGRPDMPLRKEHFVAWKVNWRRKSRNLEDLSAELGLGLDSFLLIDDDPVECSEVIAASTGAQVQQFPKDEALIRRFVAHNWLLDVSGGVTAEDRRRSDLYKENAARVRLERSQPTLKDFLEKLELEVEVETLTSAQVPRVAQLMSRTNQFNATTIRRSPPEMEQYVRDGGLGLTVALRDRFGDYGMIGALLYTVEGTDCRVTDFLMSCRALGRGVEHRTIASLARTIIGQGAEGIRIAYRPSERNVPVRMFLEEHLRPDSVQGADDGGAEYLYSTSKLVDAAFDPVRAPPTPTPEEPAASDVPTTAAAPGLAHMRALLERIWRDGVVGATQASSVEAAPPSLHRRMRQELASYLPREAPSSVADGDGRTVRFTEDDVHEFAAWSGDRNPLHVDAEYARSTAFGERVVFGVLAVLSALNEAGDIFAGARACRIKAEFAGVLLLHAAYRLTVLERRADCVRLEIRDGSKVLMRLSIESTEAFSTVAGDSRLMVGDTEAAHARRAEPADRAPNELQGGLTLAGWYDAPGAHGEFSNVHGGLSRLLALASYLVGMELPGRQALFAELEAELDLAALHADERFRFSVPRVGYDDALGLATYPVSVTQGQRYVARMKIAAFRRDTLLTSELARPSGAVAYPGLQGKNVLITGGSRGLGARLALQLALHGCNVYLNYRSNAAHAESVAAASRDLPGRVELVPGDICRESQRIAAELEHRAGRLDVLICNAAKAPLLLRATELNRPILESYLAESFRYVCEPVAALLPLLQKSAGSLVYVSSLHAEEPLGKDSEFFAYRLSKRLLEDWLAESVASQPLVRGLIVRPARMKTEMTNMTNIALRDALEPETAAAALVRTLGMNGLEAGSVRVEAIVAGEPRRLPAAEHSSFRAGGTSDPDLELVRLWRDALGLKVAHEVSHDADFFESGGTSMRLVNLIASIRKRLAPSLEYAQLPSRITLASLAAAVAIQQGTRGERSSPAKANASARARPSGRGAMEVAIVGVHARLPGADALTQYWENVRDHRILVEDVPADRTEILARAPAGWALPSGRGYRGTFLREPLRFDAEFFGISPFEAARLPPQIRLLLQSVWGAVEDSGSALGDFRRRSTGVFVAANVDSYKLLLADGTWPQLQPHDQAMRLQGMAANIAASYISHHLDLRGPSEVVNTTCSSFLVALHRAAMAVESGEAEQAVIGAANLLLGTMEFLSLERLGLIGSGETVRSFCESSDGTFVGEGVGALIVKPLRVALEDRNPIYAVIKGSAVHHGGRSVSPLAPDPGAQLHAMEAAFGRAHASLADVDYVELHGMGSSFADDAELEALREFARRQGHDRRRSIALSTVKPNVAHLMDASGLASTIKVLMALRERTIPGTMPASARAGSERLAGSPFYFEEQSRAWPARNSPRGTPEPRRASINSFGLTQICAHVLLEEHVRRSARRSRDTHGAGVIVPLSAATESGLAEYAKALLAHLRQRADLDLGDLAYTLQVGRDAMSHRVAFPVGSMAELIAQLERFAAGADDCADHALTGATASESRAARDKQALLIAKVQRWMGGAHVDWADGDPDWARGPRERLSLPTYPFAGRDYLVPSVQGASAAHASEVSRRGAHELILDMVLRQQLPLEQASELITALCAAERGRTGSATAPS